MIANALLQNDFELETDGTDFCTAALKPSTTASPCGRTNGNGAWGEHGGCIFKVGNDLYFVPTQEVADEDTLYITCDAQKIEGPLDSWVSRMELGASAGSSVETAILNRLNSDTITKKKSRGAAFVVTSDGKTFQL